MNSASDKNGVARVASIHLHPPESRQPLRSVDAIEVVEGKGIVNNGRYFGKVSRLTGKPSRRQVSLIEREIISEHSTTLGLETISPGAVRSNIETSGIDLIDLIGQNVEIGSAILHFYEARTPCEQMDAICTGLRKLMEENRQGVMAEVIRSGSIRVGDPIRVVPGGNH